MRGNGKAGYKGISLVEVFVALSIIAVLLSFAASPLERMSARIDVDMARENVVHALETARKASIRANVPVRVQLSNDSAQNRVVAGFSSRRAALDFYYLPNYTLPEHVTLTYSEGLSPIVYDPVGRVDRTGTIRLSSRLNPDYVINIRIANAAGQLVVDDGLRQKLDKLHSDNG